VKIVASLLFTTTLFAAGPRARLQTPIESEARELLANFASGQIEAATRNFNDQLRPVVTPALLAEVKKQLDQTAGQFYLVKEAHQGTKDGFRSIELIARYQKCLVSVLVLFDPFDRVQAVYFNPLVDPPADPALEAIAREVLTNFTAGHFDAAVKPFNRDMAAQLTPASMAGLAENIGGIFGTFRSVTEVHQREDKGYKVIDMTLSYTNGPVSFRVAFDDQKRVAALQIAPFKQQ
jgi:hypothetical protein